MSYYASPAMDLLYFFGLCLSEDIHLNHKDKVLKEYYKMLTTTLQKLKSKIKFPTLDEIKNCLKDRGFIEMIVSFSGLPLILADKSEIKSMDEICTEDGEWDFPGLKSALYRKIITKRMAIFEAAGYLDL